MPKQVTISIPGFKGGLAQDVYDDLNKQTFQSAKDLEVFSSTKTLTPHLSLENDSTNQTLNTIKLDSAYKGSDGRFYFKGLGTNGTTRTIWDAGSALGSSTNLTAETTAAGDDTGGHGMVEFLSNLWYWETSTIIQRFNFSSISSGILTGVSSQAPIFVHEGLLKMFYTVSAYQLGSSADTTPTSDVVLAFDPAQQIINMAPLGEFIAIGLNTKNNSKNSKIAIWGGSSTTVDDLIDLGDTGLQAIANVNGTIYALTSSNPAGGSVFNIIRLYRWRGGPVELIWEIDCKPTIANAVTINPRSVAVHKDTLYFGLNGAGSGAMTADNGVFAYNQRSNILTLDRVLSDTSSINVTSVQILDGQPVVTWYDGTNYNMSHVLSGGNKSSRGVYISNRFRLDPIFKGRIKRIKMYHDTLPASTAYVVKVKHFGTYPKGGTIPSEESFTTVTTVSDDNSTYAIIEDPTKFKWCNESQLQIEFSTVDTNNAPKVIFPIQIEAEIGDTL